MPMAWMVWQGWFGWYGWHGWFGWYGTVKHGKMFFWHVIALHAILDAVFPPTFFSMAKVGISEL